MTALCYEGPTCNHLFSNFSKLFYFVEIVLPLLVSEAYILLASSQLLTDGDFLTSSVRGETKEEKKTYLPQMGSLYMLEALL